MKCLLSGQIVNGGYTIRLLDLVRHYLGVEHVIPTNRGRTAIEIGLRALGTCDRHDVVMPSYVCDSVLDAVMRTGARPVFADVGSDLNVTPETVRAALTSRTQCVIVAHLFGTPAAIDEIESMLADEGIPLMDDAAQALGASRAGRPIGSFGSCGIVSCGPGKPLAGAAGGLLVTNNARLYQNALHLNLSPQRPAGVARRLIGFWLWRRYRAYTLPVRMVLGRLGWKPEEPRHTTNSLANVEAGIMIHQLEHLESNAENRANNAVVLRSILGELAESEIFQPEPDAIPVKLVLVLPPSGPTVKEVISAMARVGVECQRGYEPCHLKTNSTHWNLPFTEAAWRRVVCIPIEMPVKRLHSSLKDSFKQPA